MITHTSLSLSLCFMMATVYTVHCPASYPGGHTEKEFYDVNDEEYVDLVCNSTVYHDCYDSIVKSTTEPGPLSVWINSYCPPQPPGANLEAETLSRIVNVHAVATDAHKIMMM